MLSRLTQRSLLRATRTLTARDPDLAGVVETFGPPPLWARKPGFPTLIHIILEQQVSLASARAAYHRLVSATGKLVPERFLALRDGELKTIGFSRQKNTYGRALAEAILDGRLDLALIETLDDTDAKARLTAIKGIGPWTADIYLLMGLRRPDTWPNGDLRSPSQRSVSSACGKGRRPRNSRRSERPGVRGEPSPQGSSGTTT